MVAHLKYHQKFQVRIIAQVDWARQIISIHVTIQSTNCMDKPKRFIERNQNPKKRCLVQVKRMKSLRVDGSAFFNLFLLYFIHNKSQRLNSTSKYRTRHRHQTKSNLRITPPRFCTIRFIYRIEKDINSIGSNIER